MSDTQRVQLNMALVGYGARDEQIEVLPAQAAMLIGSDLAIPVVHSGDNPVDDEEDDDGPERDSDESEDGSGDDEPEKPRAGRSAGRATARKATAGK